MWAPRTTVGRRCDGTMNRVLTKAVLLAAAPEVVSRPNRNATPGRVVPRSLLRCLGWPASVGILRDEIVGCRASRGSRSRRLRLGWCRADRRHHTRARLQTQARRAAGVPGSEILASRLAAGGGMDGLGCVA
jgi:hypothetical protein